MSHQKNNEIDFNTNVPLISITNIPGRYIAKITVAVESSESGFDFYLDFENINNTWSALNPCVLCLTKGDMCMDGVKHIISTDKLEFFLRIPDCVSRANVTVHVLGTHEDDVITIPTSILDDITYVSYDKGYKENGWLNKIGNMEYYIELFKNI